MIYQTSKQITKFIISGMTAVFVDLNVYYIMSLYTSTDVAKAAGFLVGTFVTYNLNKYWTWRQRDKNNGRMLRFIVLYAVTLGINVKINNWSLNLLPDNVIDIMLSNAQGIKNEIIAIKIDKISAFIIATAASTIVSFFGQKLWVFKKASNEELAANDLPEKPGD